MVLEFDFPETNNNPDRRKGYVCDCCGSFCKEYVRRLQSSACLVLIYMVKYGKTTGFVHVENFLKEIGKSELRADYHKLRFWSLLEAKKELREDESSRNGYYKITGRGLAFVNNRISVPEHVIIFNNQSQGFEGQNKFISELLGNKFSYSELMLA